MNNLQKVLSFIILSLFTFESFGQTTLTAPLEDNLYIQSQGLLTLGNNFSTAGFNFLGQGDPSAILNFDSRNQLQDLEVIIGNSFTLSVDNISTITAFQWQSSTDGSSFSDISGETTYELSTTATEEKYYRCMLQASGLWYNTNTVHITLDYGVTKPDYDALLALYNSTSGTGWTNTWDLLTSVDTWYGVTVENDRVTSLVLSSNNLIGSISEQVGNLSQLNVLDLGTNQLSGNIPESISGLTILNQLNLRSNNLSGNLPAGMSGLSGIEYINLEYNQFTGDISILTQLTTLTEIRLNSNQFSGSLPVNLGDLTNLWWFSIQHNNLTGSIPSSVGNLDYVRYFFLWDNQLSGTIPSEIGDMAVLTSLHVEENLLEGIVPSTFTSPPFTKLFLNDNKLTGLEFDPRSLANLTDLTLADNNMSFDDIIPGYKANITNFTYDPQALAGEETTYNLTPGESYTIDLEIDEGIQWGNVYQWYKDGVLFEESNSNKLTFDNLTSTDEGVYHCVISNPEVPGFTISSHTYTIGIVLDHELIKQDYDALVAIKSAIPAIPWDLTQNASTWNPATITIENNRVTEIHLNSYSLSGTLPTEIGDLTALQVLEMGQNSLSGSIPSSIGNLDQLVELKLQGNDLAGEIPQEITTLTNIQEIYLYSNDLTGSLPSNIGDLSSLINLRVFSNDLTGSIPASITSLQSLKVLALSYCNFSGNIPSDIGNLSSLEELQLQNNEFSGEIPQSIGMLTNLTNLLLSSNNLTGEIPISIGLLSNLMNLRLNDNQLSGAVPYTLRDITSLIDIQLQDNLLETCTFNPDNHAGLNNLNLSNNSFTFEDLLPITQSSYTGTQDISNQSLVGETETKDLVPGMDVTIKIDIDNAISPANEYKWYKDGVLTETTSVNQLDITSATSSDEGIYTCEITNIDVTGLTLVSHPVTVNTTLVQGVMKADYDALIALHTSTYGTMWTNTWNLANDVSTWYGVTVENNRVTALNIVNNNVIGTIPAEIGNLNALTSLSLSYNGISGSIPAEISQLQSLTRIYLDNNTISGSIPAELTELANLEELVLSLNLLSGIIPEQLGNMESLKVFNIDDCNISGSIPPSTGQLSDLEYFHLKDNDIEGSIPTGIGNITSLKYIDFGNNLLSGTIPAELGNLSALETCLLNGNQLEGTLPDNLGNLTSLINLHLQDNNFGGVVPYSLSNLRNLSVLNLSGNNLNYLPDIFSGLTSLSILNVQNNNLTFDDILALTSLTASVVYTPQKNPGEEKEIDAQIGSNFEIYLDIDHNINPQNQYEWYKDAVLVSTTNDEVFTIGNLEPSDEGVYHCVVTNTSVPDLTLTSHNVILSLDVSNGVAQSDYDALIALYNSTDGANWTNTWNLANDVSTWYGVTVVDYRVTEINLSGNGLNGDMVSDILGLQHLKKLNLSSNNITGILSIPAGYSLDLEELNLSNNALEEQIPSAIGAFSKLITLNLSANNFEYLIPTPVLNLTKLQTLDLSSNNLSGTIPDEWDELFFLNSLNLSSNELNGNVPASFNKLYSLTALDLSDNKLTGGITEELLEDLVQIGMTSFYVNNNRFTFTSLIPLFSEGFTYSSTKTIGEEKTEYILSGDYTIDYNIDEEIPDNTYEWYKDATVIPGATDNTYTVSGITETDAGQYHTLLTNTACPGITLETEPYTLSMDITNGVATSDYNALLKLYEFTNGANWTQNTNWLGTQDVSTWYGVTVANRRVATISLSSNNLVGILPSEIGDLTALSILDLSVNQITGAFPSGIGEMASLEILRLSKNQFNGNIDFTMHNLDNLLEIDLADNQLTGSIPELFTADQITNVFFQNNNLEGQITQNLYNALSLQKIWLSGNDLSGTIPAEIGQLTSLTELVLSDNSFEGSIPVETGNLSALEKLLLSNTGLSGEVSASLNNINTFKEIDLSNNSFEGTLPAFDQKNYLEIIRFNSNSLSGNLPVNFVNGCINLQELNLADNNFTGDLPNIWGNYNVIKLLLQNNQFTGTLNSNISYWGLLEELDIHGNRFSGSIPGALGSTHPSLLSFDYSDNNYVFDPIHYFISYEGGSTIYVPQKEVDAGSEEVTIYPGDNYTITLPLTHANNSYTWKKELDEVVTDIPGNNQNTLVFTDFGLDDAGIYYCEITNAQVPGLTLSSEMVTISGPDSEILCDDIVCTGTKVDFEVVYPPLNVTTYSWDFGDGTTANDPKESHEYTASGSYVVSITMNLDNSDIITLTKNIIVKVSPELEYTVNDVAFSTTKTTISVEKDASITGYTGNETGGSSIYFSAEVYELFGTTYYTHSLMQFDLSSIPTNSVITSAKLYLFGVDHNPTYDGVLQIIDESWDENLVTWNTAPVYGSDFITIGTPGHKTDDKYIDVTGFAQTWVNDPATNFGFGFYQNSSLDMDRQFYASSDHTDASKHPKLVIEYINPIESCREQIVNLTLSGADTYNWVQNSLITCTDCAEQQLIPVTQSNLRVTASSNTGCSISRNLEIDVLETPVADAGADITLEYGNSANLNGSGTGTIEWYPTIGLTGYSNSLSPTASPDYSTVYTLTLTGTNGCFHSDQVIVNIENGPVSNAYKLGKKMDYKAIVIGNDLNIVFLVKYPVPGGLLDFMIHDDSGNVVQTGNLTTSYGYNRYAVNVSGLSVGMYRFVLKDVKNVEWYLKFEKK